MPKAFDGEKTPRVTLSLRVTPETKARIEADARASGRSLAVEAEARFEQSFLDADIIGNLRQQVEALDEWDRLLWKTEADRVAARIFAMAIHQCQLMKGASWRDDAAVALTIGKATGETLQKFARENWSRSEGEVVLSHLLGPSEDIKSARLVSDDLFDFYKDKMPALPPLDPQEDSSQRSGEAQVVVTFRNKATGEAIDKLEGPVMPLSELKGAKVPGLAEFTDKHRPNKDNIDVHFAIVHVLRDDAAAVWGTSELPEIREPGCSDSAPDAGDELPLNMPAEKPKRARKTNPKS